MNAMKVIELTNKYAKCQECGSDKLGEGSGRLEVTEDTFVRECACGWSKTVKGV